MQEPAPNPGAHAPNTWEQPQPLSTAMLSHTAWPTRRSGARNHTGDAISTGAGLLREIKLEGKPQFPTTRGVRAHDNHRLRLARNQPAHPGHSPGTEETPGGARPAHRVLERGPYGVLGDGGKLPANPASPPRPAAHSARLTIKLEKREK